MTPKSILIGAALAAGLFEAASAPFLDGVAGKAAGGAYAAMFLTSAWALRTRTTGPTVALLLIFGFELAFLPVYDRVTVTDWLAQGGFGVVSVIGLSAAVGVLAGRRHGTTTPAQSLRTRT